MEKPYVKASEVRASLIALRDELAEKVDAKTASTDQLVLMLKINSCLYKKYPIHAR